MFDDLKLAWKRLRNEPGFTLVAVLTLGLAVGANTAIFTVADAVLFRPLPYDEPEQLFVIRSVDRASGFRSSGVPYEYVAAIQRHHSGVAAVALRSPTTMTTHPGSDGAESIETFVAAPDYFRILGARAIRGRLFDADDAAEGSRRAVLTYESWRTRFGGDESIIGRAVRLGSADRTVIGILPPGFIFPSASLWYSDAMTGRAEYATVGPPPVPDDPMKWSSVILRGRASDAIVRLRPGVTRETAQAELDVLMASTPPRPKDARPYIALDDLRSLLFPTGRQVLLLLLASAGLVLLIGCGNLANMLIARTHRRQRELAVQAALGAGRRRLMRPVLFETLMIGTAAAGLAIGLTAFGFDVLMREVPPAAYGRATIGVDLRVGAFALALGVAAGVLFAIVPAWRLTRLDVQPLIRRSNHRSTRGRPSFGHPMIAAQVALAVVIVAGASTSARSFLEVVNRPLGFSPEGVMMLRVSPKLEEIALRDFHDRVIAALRARGDVVAAGLGSSRPFDRFRGAESAGRAPQKLPVVHMLPGYLEALGVRLREGRLPDSGDSPTGLEPAVLTRSAARMLFSDGLVIGRTVDVQGRASEVVAVIDDVVDSFDEPSPWIYIVPRDRTRLSTIVVRTRARSARTFADVRRDVVALAPPTEPVTAGWLADSIGAHSGYRDPRFQTVVLGAFGTLALVLATLGIFAVVAATVARRTREMGVRLAIGAPPRALVRLVVKDTFVPIALGIAAGVAAAQLLGRLARAQMAGLDGADLDALGVAVLAVAVAGVLAAYLPARRVSRVDPIVVLRAE